MGSPIANITSAKAPMAQATFGNPYSRVSVPPIASHARNAIGPSAVLPTRAVERRARCAVKRSA
jgi:hypothetical protein